MKKQVCPIYMRPKLILKNNLGFIFDGHPDWNEHLFHKYVDNVKHEILIRDWDYRIFYYIDKVKNPIPQNAIEAFSKIWGVWLCDGIMEWEKLVW